MPTTDAERRAPAHHQGFLRPVHPTPHVAIDAWSRSALENGHKLLTLTAPTDPHTQTRPRALSPDDLHPSSTPARLVHAALAEGFTGLSVLIRADQVIAETSADFHDAIESALTALCAEHPVRVLCVYDRPGAGTQHLDLAVTHHRGGLQEHLLTVRDAEGCTNLGGEVDMTNLDVFDAALRACRTMANDVVRVDLSGTAFLSAGAADILARHATTTRDGLARVELHNLPRHVRRVLWLTGRTVPAEDRPSAGPSSRSQTRG
jgi:anti-anti-sigma regulatory factor